MPKIRQFEELSNEAQRVAGDVAVLWGLDDEKRMILGELLDSADDARLELGRQYAWRDYASQVAERLECVLVRVGWKAML